MAKAVGNEVVDDIEKLSKVGFKFEKSRFWTTDKTLSFTAHFPSFYICGYGKKPFFGATYLKPESSNLSGPKLISA